MKGLRDPREKKTGPRSWTHKLPTGTFTANLSKTERRPSAKDKGENTRPARTRAGTSGGSAEATASSREDGPQLSLTRPGPAPRRRASSRAPPPTLARREAGARSLRSPPPGLGVGGAAGARVLELRARVRRRASAASVPPPARYRRCRRAFPSPAAA